MKVKTSVSLSEDLIEQIDRRVAAPGRRSDFIENAVREHLQRLERQERDERDIAIYNRLAADPHHRAELEEVLSLQADVGEDLDWDE